MWNLLIRNRSRLSDSLSSQAAPGNEVYRQVKMKDRKRKDRKRKDRKRSGNIGFTLLEVMISVAIIAIALMAVLGSQSQGSSLANESKFNTTATLLAQSKMAEMESRSRNDMGSDSGVFGDDFPEYAWEISVQGLVLEELAMASERVKQIDVKVSWLNDPRFQFKLRVYRFFPTGL